MALYTELGPGGYPQPPQGPFSGKPAFGRVYTVLSPGGYSRPPWGSFAGKTSGGGKVYTQTFTVLSPGGYSMPPQVFTAKPPSAAPILGGVVRGEIAWGGILPEDLLDRLRRLNEGRDKRWLREREREVGASLRAIIDEALGRIEKQVGALPSEAIVVEAEQAGELPRDLVFDRIAETITDIVPAPDAPLMRIYREIVEEIDREREEDELELLLLSDAIEWVDDRPMTADDQQDDEDVEMLLG